MTEKIKIDEAIGSLTGFDELAIEERFGADLGSLNGSMTIRALVFVQERLAGKDDKAAYGEAMRMTIRAASDLFAEVGDNSGEGKA